MTTEWLKAIQIVFCYAHEDEKLLKELKAQLVVLQRQKMISIWYDHDINAGTEWERETNAYLNTADIILLLISPDFIASEYCYSVEMTRAMERYRCEGTYVIPILLRPVDFEGTPISQLDILPTNGKHITWFNRDKVFSDIAKHIRKIVKTLLFKKLIDVGDTQFAANLYSEALEAYEQALQLNSNDAGTLGKKGDTLVELKLHSKALEVYEQALQFDSNNVALWSKRGAILFSLRLYEEAILAYKQAIRLDPNDATLYKKKGDIFGFLRRYKEALNAYNQAIRLAPNDAVTYYAKANALLELKEYEEALAAYEQAIQRASSTSDFYKGKGNVLLRLNHDEEAVEAYRQAVRFAHNDEIAYQGLGHTLIVLEKYEEALTAYEQALQINSEKADFYADKGHVLLNLKRYEEALVVYEKAIRLIPDNAEFYSGKGRALSGIGRFGEALHAYNQAMRYKTPTPDIMAPPYESMLLEGIFDDPITRTKSIFARDKYFVRTRTTRQFLLVGIPLNILSALIVLVVNPFPVSTPVAILGGAITVAMLWRGTTSLRKPTAIAFGVGIALWWGYVAASVAAHIINQSITIPCFLLAFAVSISIHISYVDKRLK